jgi:regulator of replication initiation timing
MVKILKPIYELFRNVDTLKHNKVYFLLLSTILFSFIYLCLGDEHFSGVNKFKQEVREEVVKDAVRKELVENFVNENNKLPIEFTPLDPELMKTPKEEEIIDTETKKAKKDVIKTDLQTETVQQSPLQSLYNRLYFSIVTGTLLGYGDIYPITNTSKLLAMIQSLCTIALILS